MIEKQLTLQQIQDIAAIIDDVKKNDDSKDLEVKPLYWLGRLRDWCTPILDRIQESSNTLINKHTIKKNPNGTRNINQEEFGLAMKKLLSETETIKIPILKASMFMKEDKSLVSTSFWQIMTPHIEIDVDWMKEEKVKEKIKK